MAIDFIIFGLPKDKHVQRVTTLLRARGVEVVTVSPISDEALSPLHLELRGGKLEASISGSKIDGRRLPLVWMRNKFFPISTESLDDQRRKFESSSRQAAMFTLIDSLNLPVVNGSNLYRDVSSKVLQGKIAAQHGLIVPETVVSSDRSQLLGYINGNPNCILKALGKSWVEGFRDFEGEFHDPISLMTSRIDIEDIKASSTSEVASIPVIVQPEIEKSYELRTVVVGDEIMHFRVNSQDDERTHLDWRLGEQLPGIIDDTPHTRSSVFDSRIRKFMKTLDLEIGVLDFAVTPSGNEIFFECNPNGQWALLESDQLPHVSQKIAKYFELRIRELQITRHR